MSMKADQHEVQVSDYVENNVESLKTEAYYCTRRGKVKGILTLNKYLLMFDPITCKENNEFVSWTKSNGDQKDLIRFQACVDLQDVSNV